MTATSTGAGVRHASVSIRLEAVTKAYAGSATPAVDALDLDIPAGELVALVGPSR